MSHLDLDLNERLVDLSWFSLSVSFFMIHCISVSVTADQRKVEHGSTEDKKK